VCQYTQIFGANGYGKTTFCAILRSLGSNDSGLLAGRVRVGSTSPPSVELLFDSRTVKFDKGAWNAVTPEIIIFDGAFIATRERDRSLGHQRLTTGRCR
jgi:hypothetical protein